LQEVALSGGNVFAELLETVKSCSLGQITGALYAVGGKYRAICNGHCSSVEALRTE
jgi:isobutyryl-CoA mutase